MKNFFYNKIILISGGSSGIGRALAQKALEYGAKVAICGRNAQKLEQIKREPGFENLFIFQADVSQKKDCKAWIDAVINHFGGIDILINNAGMSMRALFAEADLQVLQQLMDINFWGAVNCTHFALPHIIAKKGTVVGISSIAGFKGLPARSGYSASKFALQGFLEALRIEMIPKNVNVLIAAPGFTASNIRNTALNADGKAQSETPLNESKLMSAETCATYILRAIAKGKRTLVLTFQGKLTVLLSKFFPAWTDKLVLNHFKKEPDSPLK